MTQGWPGVDGTAPQRVGEVVESASHCYTAQCYRLYEAPPLGAFIRTGPAPGGGAGPGGDDRPARTYAVVYGVSTGSLDPGRPVVARGEYEDSEEDVYRSNPQISRLLSTRFEAAIVGHSNGAAFVPYLPPLPPRIHSFVYPCVPGEVVQVTGSSDFLRLLVESSPAGRGVTDEVIAACLRQAGAQREDPRSFLVPAGKALAVYLSGDLTRLNSILRRLSP